MESQPHRVNPNQRFLNFESAYEYYKAPASAPPPPPSPLNNVPNNYTNEDVQLVSRILNSNDGYRILGVNDTSSSEEIRNAYRVLSTKVHPNFNKAPGSHEAFKKVNEAYDALNLLASIQNIVVENGQDRTGCDETLEGVGIVAALLIFLLLLFVSQQDDPYKVEVSGDYNIPMKTKECGIEFYVKSIDGFDTNYPVGSQERTHIEKAIVHDFVDNVRHNSLCEREQHVHLQYPNTPTPNCDKLKCLGKDQG